MAGTEISELKYWGFISLQETTIFSIILVYSY